MGQQQEQSLTEHNTNKWRYFEAQNSQKFWGFGKYLFILISHISTQKKNYTKQAVWTHTRQRETLFYNGNYYVFDCGMTIMYKVDCMLT